MHWVCGNRASISTAIDGSADEREFVSGLCMEAEYGLGPDLKQ